MQIEILDIYLHIAKPFFTDVLNITGSVLPPIVGWGERRTERWRGLAATYGQTSMKSMYDQLLSSLLT
jgi:hypothetical protein